MPILAKWLIIAVVSYLLGSLSFAIIVSKVLYKKDIRTYGSGNAGMTNILRTFGKKAAALTIIGDVLKGTVAVMFARLMFYSGTTYLPQATNSFSMFNFEFHYSSPELYKEIGMYIALAAVFFGHIYPCFFQFKGGKGVSVIAGALIAATPVPLALALSLFFIIVYTTKIVSLASIIASTSYLFITIAYSFVTKTVSVPNLVVAIVFPLIIVWSHRENIKRLKNGTEYKFGQNKNK